MLTYRKDFDKSYAILSGFKDTAKSKLVFNELRVQLTTPKDCHHYHVFGYFTMITYIKNDDMVIKDWKPQLCYFMIRGGNTWVKMLDGRSKKINQTKIEKFLFDLFKDELNQNLAYSGFIDLDSLSFKFSETEKKLTTDMLFPKKYKGLEENDLDAWRNKYYVLQSDYNVLLERYRAAIAENYQLRHRGY